MCKQRMMETKQLPVEDGGTGIRQFYIDNMCTSLYLMHWNQTILIENICTRIRQLSMRCTGVRPFQIWKDEYYSLDLDNLQ